MDLFVNLSINVKKERITKNVKMGELQLGLMEIVNVIVLQIGAVNIAKMK